MKSCPKTILITGGTQGIGFAIAERFLADGFTVVVCGSTQESVDAALARLPGLAGVVCDVSKAVAVQIMADRIAAEYGALGILVNNAGKYEPGTLLGEADGALESMLSVNLMGAYRLARALAPAMAERGSGTIVNICSTASVMGYPNGGSYCISKHALLGFSRTLREELKGRGVRVVSVIPGATMTKSWEGSGVDPGRMMPPEDVALAVWSAHAMSERSVVEEIVMRPMLGDLA